MAQVVVRQRVDVGLKLGQLAQTVEVKLLQKSMREGQKLVAAEAKVQAPRQSGALAKSIRVVTNRKAVGRGFARVDVKAGNAAAFYAHMANSGTGSFYAGSGKSARAPYLIRAKDSTGRELPTKQKRQSLRIGAKFVGSVVHPGIKPNLFMKRAADAKLGTEAVAVFAKTMREGLAVELAK